MGGSEAASVRDVRCGLRGVRCGRLSLTKEHVGLARRRVARYSE